MHKDCFSHRVIRPSVRPAGVLELGERRVPRTSGDDGARRGGVTGPLPMRWWPASPLMLIPDRLGTRSLPAANERLGARPAVTATWRQS